MKNKIKNLIKMCSEAECEYCIYRIDSPWTPCSLQTRPYYWPDDSETEEIIKYCEERVCVECKFSERMSCKFVETLPMRWEVS